METILIAMYLILWLADKLIFAPVGDHDENLC